MTINYLRRTLERRKGKLSQIQTSIKNTKREVKFQTRNLNKHIEAREIIREVGLQTQQQLQFHISDITSLALEAVFTNPYKLSVEFIQRRNKTECDLKFVRDGKVLDPIASTGYGAVDVAAFALRIASWSMQNPKTLATILLDEPFRFLSKDHQEQASQMIKELSNKLGLQFIIVTHESILATNADKVFSVTQNKSGVSIIKGG